MVYGWKVVATRAYNGVLHADYCPFGEINRNAVSLSYSLSKECIKLYGIFLGSVQRFTLWRLSLTELIRVYSFIENTLCFLSE